MAWPGLRKCTAYLSPGQDSLPLGVRWFSDGLGRAPTTACQEIWVLEWLMKTAVSLRRRVFAH